MNMSRGQAGVGSQHVMRNSVLRNDLTNYELRITSVADSLDVGFELLLQTNVTSFSEQASRAAARRYGRKWER